jgi:hypothetical protein
VAGNRKNFAIRQREKSRIPASAAIGLARLEIEVPDASPGAGAWMIDPAAVFSQEVQIVAVSLVVSTPFFGTTSNQETPIGEESMSAAKDVGVWRADGLNQRAARQVEKARVVEIDRITTLVLGGVMFAAAEHQNLIGGQESGVDSQNLRIISNDFPRHGFLL